MERNVLIDKLRGYACFLVLFGHVIMGIRLSGVEIPKFFHSVEEFVWSFHVALFLFISGVVYKETGEWRKNKSRIKFILNKFLNLGVPYLFFSAVYIAINSLVSAANTNSSFSDILSIWKAPVAQYWYLYALFFLFCIWTTLSTFIRNWLITVIVVFLAYLLSYFGISLGGFDIVLSVALPFGIATFLDFKKLKNIPCWVKVISIISHLAIGAIIVLSGNVEKLFYKEFMYLLGIFSSIQLIDLIHEIKIVSIFLSFMNRYSLQIYLLHTIFTAGIRIILIRLSITQWWIHVAFGIICGIFFSVIAAIIANKSVVLDFVFFPSKTMKRLKKQKKSADNA